MCYVTGLNDLPKLSQNVATDLLQTELPNGSPELTCFGVDLTGKG